MQGTKSKAVHDAEWLDAGACRNEDPELFFPITSSGPSAQQIAAAKAVCASCGVQNQCLRYALESHQSHGVWGGTSEEERQRMTSSRGGNRGACAPAPGPRRPSRRKTSGREGRNAGYRA
jgi:WhiB family redox-sensing transcriptional regulator